MQILSIRVSFPQADKVSPEQIDYYVEQGVTIDPVFGDYTVDCYQGESGTDLIHRVQCIHAELQDVVDGWGVSPFAYKEEF